MTVSLNEMIKSEMKKIMSVYLTTLYTEPTHGKYTLFIYFIFIIYFTFVTSIKLTLAMEKIYFS